jgi:hypothetical protein
MGASSQHHALVTGNLLEFWFGNLIRKCILEDMGVDEIVILQEYL